MQDAAEALEVLVDLAGGELAGGVDLRRGALLGLRVGGAPAADRVEGFQAEAEGVDLAVALGAGAVGAVLGEALADGGRAGDVGLDGGHDVRRRRRLDAEDVLTDPGATGDGRGFDAVGADRQDGGHAEQSSAVTVAFQADLLEAVGQAQRLLLREVVQLGQALVDVGVIRVQELGHRAVLPEHGLEEHPHLRLHRSRQILGVIGAVRFTRGRHPAEVAQVEPAVEEAVDEAFDAGVGQHAVDLPLQFRIAGQLARPGRGGQDLVRRRGPEGVGEAGGKVVGLEAPVAFRRDFAQIQEGRRAEDELDRVERRLARLGLLGDALLIHRPNRRTVGVRQRTTVGLGREGEELLERPIGLEALRAEDGDLLGAARGLGDRALDDDLADADVGQLALPEDVGPADARRPDGRREFLLVALVDGQHGGA